MDKSKSKKSNQKRTLHIKRQWGTEKGMEPLPNLHEKPSSRAIAFSRISIMLTVLFWIGYVISVVLRQLVDGPKSYDFTLEALGYLIIVTFLTFSALIYLITRQGALLSFKKHTRTPRALLSKHFTDKPSSITVLIPSLQEEIEVVRKTMFSAALQEYPDLKIVLLIDDDPFTASEEDKSRLKATRNIAKELEELLADPKEHAVKALKKFQKNNKQKKLSSTDEIKKVAAHYSWAANWLSGLAQKWKTEDHVDIFFANEVLQDLSNSLKLTEEAILALHKEKVELSQKRVLQLYNRLVWIFTANISFFERKRYISLSRELNKAMNLNAYIGLMGGYYKKEKSIEGTILLPVENKEDADLEIPNSDFILTLDADSVLLKEYCLRLVYLLQQPNNKDVAVAQTPYSSFRGAPSRIERLAGATTDIQHIIHQGMSYYNATFWVGANAIIRKNALEDIVEKEWIGGFEIKRYIQDRTVIEDTESSIDMAIYDWRLLNYPERLSYSATPPDFGSLIIQRRRWANGGLLIVPKLWKLISKRKNAGRPISKLEFIIRLNYMASIAWSNIGLIFLLAYPYNGRLLSPLVLLAATPYFISMAIDLKRCRYNYTDIFRIYGFNLILLPVNIAGTLKSIQQAFSATKTPFARTPKVKNRTASGLIYVVIPILIVAFSIFTLLRNIESRNLGNAIFAGFNAFAATWAILAYIGFWNTLVDIWLGIVEMFHVDVISKQKNKGGQKNKFNWEDVLYHGEGSKVIHRETLNKMLEDKK